jgi:hypothetical protein
MSVAETRSSELIARGLVRFYLLLETMAEPAK